MCGDIRWVLRALLLALMRSGGARRLRGADQVSPAAFATAFPDQSDWVARLLKCADRQGAQVRHSLADFLEWCGLGGQPPEYATMHMCIWGSSQLPPTLPALWEGHERSLTRWIRDYRQEHCMWPHPLTVVEQWSSGP